MSTLLPLLTATLFVLLSFPLLSSEDWRLKERSSSTHQRNLLLRDKARNVPFAKNCWRPLHCADILEDDSINCVVELMGGVTHAKDVVFKALKKGKHVVTANKALLAQLLPEVGVRRSCRRSKRTIPRCPPPPGPSVWWFSDVFTGPTVDDFHFS